MALHLLWLGLMLQETLQTQVQNSSSTVLSRPSLSMVPLQPNFQEDQFQGKWYALGVAENTVQNGSQREFKMFSDTYELKEDHSYNLTTRLLRELPSKGQFCDYWTRTIVPDVHPGQFTLGNITLYVGTQSYTMRVAITNYSQVAIVFSEKIFRNTVYFKTTLYGRTKQLSPNMKSYFISFAKHLGFTEDNILFTAPNDQCID
ncbi:neutrophil gelatinase-associated lipocalin-like [Cavia porcellus]|uniref:neutrophil gelatinase-associated lipocalin-like n=1 Tax=Cavia porcellus TaxID=10141 RepID=UPI000184E3F6|nr:neutrophil gelatinase-associated lipocalin-like [Cavia porcellus]